MNCKSIELYVEKLTEQFTINMDEYFEWDGSLEKDITGFSKEDLIQIVNCLHDAVEITSIIYPTELVNYTIFNEKTKHFNASEFCINIRETHNNLSLDDLINSYFVTIDLDII